MPASPPPLPPGFTSVYEVHFPYVWKVLARLGVPERDREDLAHDVFAIAYRHYPGFDPKRALKPWLFGICFRRVLDFKRKGQNRLEEPTDDIDAVSSSKSAEELVADDTGRCTGVSFPGDLQDDSSEAKVAFFAWNNTVPNILACAKGGSVRVSYPYDSTSTDEGYTLHLELVLNDGSVVMRTLKGFSQYRSNQGCCSRTAPATTRRAGTTECRCWKRFASEGVPEANQNSSMDIGIIGTPPILELLLCRGRMLRTKPQSTA